MQSSMAPFQQAWSVLKGLSDLPDENMHWSRCVICRKDELAPVRPIGEDYVCPKCEQRLNESNERRFE